MAKTCSCGRHPAAKPKTVVSLVLAANHYERHGRNWCGDIERWPQCQRKDNYGNTTPTPMLFISIA